MTQVRRGGRSMVRSTPEQRERAVAAVVELLGQGCSLSAAARTIGAEMGFSRSAVSQWAYELAPEETAVVRVGELPRIVAQQQAEIERLRREVHRLGGV